MKKMMLMAAVVLIIAQSCTPGGKIGSTKLSPLQAYQQGNYQQALDMWSAQIASFEKKDNGDECPVYTAAASAALKLGDTEKALGWLKKAAWQAQPVDSTYLLLAQIYRKEDNLSLEMLSLQDYLSHYPDGKEADAVNRRLFPIYVESQNWDKAVSTWNVLPASIHDSLPFTDQWFTVNEAIGNDHACDSLAGAMLHLDADNMRALQWLGKKYYRQAEDLYQTEMKAYEEHRTHKQYARLLKQLEVITRDFKRSKDYFLRAYELEADAQTALYLSYIYNRLDDKARSDHYRSLSGK